MNDFRNTVVFGLKRVQGLRRSVVFSLRFWKSGSGSDDAIGL